MASKLATLISVLVMVKLYIKYTTGMYTGKKRLDGKTTIVTGASSGIGIETAKDFAKRGARVLMLCRDLKKAEKVRQEIISATNNSNIVIKYVDFTSLSSVRKCANEIISEEERIDVLVNNAGAAYVDVHEKTKDGLNLLMQTNHLAGFLLTNILLGKMKESAPSRIVVVSSYMHYFADLDVNDLQQDKVNTKGRHYSNTKLANVYFAMILAEKLKGTGVTANSLHPGVIPTAITRGYNPIVFFLNTLLAKMFCKTALEGAQTSIYLAVSDDVKDISGEYFRDCKLTPIRGTPRDHKQATLLWEMSEKAVGLQEHEKHY